MEQNTLKRLEFDKICQMLQKHASFSLSRDKAISVRPTPDFEQAAGWLHQTDEGYRLLFQFGDLPFGGIQDISPSVDRAGKGGLLTPEALLAVQWTLQGARKLKRYLLKQTEKDAEAYPYLRTQAEAIEEFPEVEQGIAAAIDEQAAIRDDASLELTRIRRQMRHLESRMRERLEAMIRDPNILRMLQEPLITIRHDHLVLPVKAHYRNVFGGVVYDQSASGSTLFIEPDVVARDNRQLQELRVQERKEEERILRRLSAMVGEADKAILQLVERLADLDLVMAKARLAREMAASKPELNDQGIIRLRKAKHPLLDPATVVPIDLELGVTFRTLVITGPNTGGKTVTLKTIGLLSCMAMAGLFVPAAEGTQVSVFSGIYVDIGDEQSIEQNLSTFSSHMRNMIDMLERADAKALLLFDELGAGTDPQEGAALATAILEEVHRRGCRVVATTHYSELKAYAYNREGVSNASVEFDVESLRPTYRLMVGVPGRSNAFVIAERLGLPRHVLQMAREQLDEDSRHWEAMVSSLEQRHQQMEEQLEELAALRKELAEKERQLARRDMELMRERQRLQDEMSRKVEEVVEAARKEAAGLLAELKERVKQSSAVKPHQITEWEKKLEQISARQEQPTIDRSYTFQKERGDASDAPLLPGSEVLVLPFGQRGTVVELQGEQALVQMGQIKLSLSKHQLQLVESKKKQSPAPAMVRLVTQERPVRPELDLRGQRVDEALAELDKYLDEVSLAGLKQVHLIHGKGTGSLRQAIQEYLRTHPQVNSYRLGNYHEGGSGVTVVVLK